MKASRLFLFFIFCQLLFLVPKESKAQSDSASTVYAFLKLKDGSNVSGKIISREAKSVSIDDFLLGNLTIKSDQIISEADVKVGAAVCLTLFTGQKYCGTITECNDMIKLNTASLGEINIDPKKIKEVQNASDVKIVNGEEWFENPQPNRYFFAPSAIPLKKGEGYFQNVMLDLNTVNYGLSDHVSIGGGFAVPWAYMVSLKVGYKVAPKIHAGGGVVFAGSFFGLNIGMGAAYGLLTIGSLEKNITLSAGYGLSNFSGNRYDSWALAKYPSFIVSGMSRVGKKFALVTENWIFPLETTHYTYNYPNPPIYTYTYGYNAALSAGFRTMWQKSSFDLAVMSLVGTNFNNFQTGNGVFLPYLDYVFKF